MAARLATPASRASASNAPTPAASTPGRAAQTANTKGFLKSAGEAQLVSTDTTEWIVAHDRTNLKTYVRTYGGLTIQAVDLKRAGFDKPGLRTIELQNDFQPVDVTEQAQPLGK